MIWTARDRRGRSVVLLADVWVHVLDQHGDMFGLELAVRQVVERPDFVNRDGRFPERECAYRGNVEGGWIKVVIAYSERDGQRGGRVVTAYRTRRVPSKESPLWP